MNRKTVRFGNIEESPTTTCKVSSSNVSTWWSGKDYQTFVGQAKLSAYEQQLDVGSTHASFRPGYTTAVRLCKTYNHESTKSTNTLQVDVANVLDISPADSLDVSSSWDVSSLGSMDLNHDDGRGLEHWTDLHGRVRTRLVREAQRTVFKTQHERRRQQLAHAHNNLCEPLCGMPDDDGDNVDEYDDSRYTIEEYNSDKTWDEMAHSYKQQTRPSVLMAQWMGQWDWYMAQQVYKES